MSRSASGERDHPGHDPAHPLHQDHAGPAAAMTDPAFAAHDHAGCAAHVLAAADRTAADRGLRLTPVRRKVLEILLEEHRALGAYAVLDRLAAAGFGNQPPVAYRALDFLVEHGFAHRVQRLNAFAACMAPGRDHAPVFLICEGCGVVAEGDGRAVRAALDDAAQGAGFAVTRSTVEAVGLCPACQGPVGAAA
jgi:Fur family zinc uptake transcriptional regulator